MVEFKDVLISKEVKNLDAIPAKIADMLADKQLKIAVCESITGGDISANLVQVPGASDFYVGGVIAYNNFIKVSECNVNPKTIQRYGVVSSEVALEMAKGIRTKFHADIGLATTGFAGPQRETEKVGMVHIGLSINTKDITKNFLFTGERIDIIKQTSFAALELLRFYLTA